MAELIEGVNADRRGGVLRARSGGNSGNSLISMENVPSALDFTTNLEGGINASLETLLGTMQDRANPLDVYTQLEEASGLPGQQQVANTLREQIYGIEDTIKRVAPTIKATTKQSMVTEGQRERMEVTQKAPLLERLGELGTGLGRVEAAIATSKDDLANKINLYLRGQEMELEPLRLQYQAVVDQASRLTTAFGIDSQNQLSVYMANVQRGWELSDQEREEAFALIQNENAYTQLLQTSAASAGISLTGNESNDDILEMIGNTAAEELQYARNNKAADTDFSGFDWWNRQGTGSDWVIVPNSGNPSGGGSLQPPQQSANPGTVQTTNGPGGSKVYWVMGQNGRWE